jgi:GcrA cell cycle regulator
MPGESWSFERVALLQRLWAEGITAADIGERLGGLSRSAVLGKIFRLRLGSEGASAAPPPHRAPDTHDRNDAAPSRRRRRQPRRRRPAATPSAALSPHKTLLELTNATCRWPHGRPGTARFFFCGASGADLEQGLPYCPLHMRRAYRPEARLERVAPVAGKTLRRPKEVV